ncbi:MAG: hypothetical protein KBF93_17335 [Leptospiraceae bacterium]|nr:hypothetical protein [Leptospiraceae bacterium]
MKLAMIIRVLKTGFKFFLLATLFIIIFSEYIISYPYTSRPGNCDTSGQYASDTKATVYGDSRMDYMGGIPGFPWHDMDAYLQYPNERTWSVQNFGLNGESSTGLQTHLEECLKHSPPATTISTGNYKIHENVAFHIGGNDFVHSLFTLYLFPWKQKEYVRYAKYNNERIVVMLLRKRRNVLLTGHYPALSMSSSYHLNEVYLRPKNRAVMDNIALGYTIPDMNLSLVNSKVGQCFGKEALLIPADSDFFLPIDPKSWYINVPTGEFLGTIPSLGIMNLEPRIVEIAERRKSQFTTVGKTLTHLPIWNCFRYEAGPFAWVVDPSLMVDLIHPNVTGFALWGLLVGNKMNQLGFNTSNFSIVNQSIPAPLAVEDPDPVPPPSPPSNEDTLLLIAICFATGICG